MFHSSILYIHLVRESPLLYGWLYQDGMTTYISYIQKA